MSSIIIKTELEFYCGACGAEVEATLTGFKVEVDPCQTCIVDAKHEALDDLKKVVLDQTSMKKEGATA